MYKLLQGLVPEDADAFVKRIHALRDRYEDTYLPASQRRVSQEEQEKWDDEQLQHSLFTAPLYDATGCASWLCKCVARDVLASLMF